MGFSRSARIITLLIIDTAFFFLELIVGYAVGSLALVADSFHMLNDVFSLIVALYTIRLATSPSSAANSYGWQRAEILGALINGVFLLALCMTIALEAIGRIVEPPEISNPKLIVVVGSLGLLSNIVGLFLFHDHGHSHGGGGHSHGAIALPADVETGATEGQNPSHHRQRADSMSSLYQHPAQTRAQVIEAAHEYGLGRASTDEGTGSGFNGPMSPPSHHHHGRAGSVSRRAGAGSGKGSAKGALSPLSATTSAQSGQAPAGNQAGAVSYAQAAQHAIEDETESATSTVVANGNGNGKAHSHPHKHNHDENGKLAKDASAAESGHAHEHGHGHDHSHEGHRAVGEAHDHSHEGHGHGGHGHSHGSMNMHGVFLHVLGDALGNVGVIAAGLVIWFCQGRWTLYFDPAVSLLITCIIFSSALPLVKSASYILMQGVPSHVSLEAVRSATKSVPGVVSVHELHIWQLSETTVVASVHVMITPGVEYMDVASGIRKVMHRHGIHSVTIQPEFYAEGASTEEETACLIRCPPEVCGTETCCPPATTSENGDSNSHEGHSH